MIIKVCGMRNADNIREVEQLSINMMGFIFWPKSSRFVSERPAYLPTNCKRVGVFVNETIEQVGRIADEYGLDYIQLHGHESPAYIQELKKSLSIIKAFNIAEPADFEQTKAYEGVADLFLFDTKGKSVGGNGEKFNWDVLKAYTGETPFLLSGGIGPDDASLIKSFYHPKCIGIDLNSRFEITPGLKDISKLKTFINSL
ncbi:MAG: phosphoribosylanthranilate isomerase [Bacteroidaceae bacterium]|nr:phosphoribosylanthranilate isomerase [Bacteroidaceae bacterium]